MRMPGPFLQEGEYGARLTVPIICVRSIITSCLLIPQPPPGIDAPMMDTAEMVYISSLALLKVSQWAWERGSILTRNFGQRIFY